MTLIVNVGKTSDAFAQGGNRLCFFYPDEESKCIKILRQDRMPEIRRQKKSFFKRFKPLSYFDENKSELKEIQAIKKSIGDKVFEHIPHCYGLLQTNLGMGLALELIRDQDLRVSITLKQYLWTYGMTETLKLALDQFYVRWAELGVPSKDLLLHNIVVQQQCVNDELNVKRLVVIDGFGWAGFRFPFFELRSLSIRRAMRKTQKLSSLINAFLKKERDQSNWGYHGWLDESQRVKSHD